MVLGMGASKGSSAGGIRVVMMEMGLPQSVATLVAASDGAASLYVSSGGGLIGAGEYENVRAAALEMVEKAEESLASMKPSKEFPLVPAGMVKFHVVTGRGVLSCEGREAELREGSHELSELFYQGHELIGQMRILDEEMERKAPHAPENRVPPRAAKARKGTGTKTARASRPNPRTA